MSLLTSYNQTILIVTSEDLILIAGVIFVLILLVCYYLRKKFIELEDEIDRLEYKTDKILGTIKRLENVITEKKE